MKTKEDAVNQYHEALKFGYNINPTPDEVSGYNVMIELMEQQIKKNDYAGACFTANDIFLLKQKIIKRQVNQLNLFSSSLVQPAVR